MGSEGGSGSSNSSPCHWWGCVYVHKKDRALRPEKQLLPVQASCSTRAGEAVPAGHCSKGCEGEARLS